MSEHIKFDKDGNIDGLYVVNTDKAKDSVKGTWERIDAVVRSYTEINPMEIAAQVESNKVRRSETQSKFGATKDKTMRFGVSIPVALMMRLEALEPDLFNNKKMLNKFMRKYPAFRIASEV